MSEPTCAFASCTCLVETEDPYCSATCRRSAAAQKSDEPSGCLCEHVGCLGAAGRDRPEGLEEGHQEPVEDGPRSSG